MSRGTLLDKVWDLHTVKELPTGQTQLFIGLHYLHEVTSPQAFDMLRENGWKLAYPPRTYATADHVVPTDTLDRPFKDSAAEKMLAALERNTREFGIRFFGLEDGRQGIVHVVGPELGLTQPGMTIACGDSHTSTNGAFGSLAFGVGTSQVRDILATQCIAAVKPKVRRIEISGKMGKGVYAKDVALAMMRTLGVNGGIGYAQEYAGETVRGMGMEERMTLCNMSIECGATIGYANPDTTTFDYLRGREFAPQGTAFTRAEGYWSSIASSPNATFDDTVGLDASVLEPMVTWGINPGQSIGISEKVPDPVELPETQRENARLALAHMGLRPGQTMEWQAIDVAFIGSCTNGRLTDLREAAKIVEGRKMAPRVRGIVVPGSRQVKLAAEELGLDKVFAAAGFEWRNAGCSMCLGMNPDKLVGSEQCASSSNRNFLGRQGSPNGRTVLMSPAMVAAAAVAGKIVDMRRMA